MPGFLGRLFRDTSTFARLTAFFDERADPWQSLEIAIPHRAFGQGSEREFCAYLEGPSRVAIRSLEDLCAWLKGCEAVDDRTLFFDADFWQHPVTFEQVRKGDCEDHALWAWRQCWRLGLPARFVAGLLGTTAHAWVNFNRDGREYLLETTAKTGDLIHPLPSVRHRYSPALAVDTECRTFVYQGYPRFRLAMENPPPSLRS